MMRYLIILLVLLSAAVVPAPTLAATLSDDEAATLVFMREEEKLARDAYREMFGLWGGNLFENISLAEQRHMDAMLSMILRYGLEDPVGDNPPGVFQDQTLALRYDDMILAGSASLAGAMNMGAAIEELDMIDLAAAIDGTDEEPLKRAYSNLLSASCNHLRTFVVHVVGLEGAYAPKYLDSQTFSDCVGDLDEVPVGNGTFSINAGLNDAWYYPGTNGQGFSIIVFPGVKRVFLMWFTFDVAPPAPGTLAGIGDPGQRWLVAEGYYEGAQADLTIYSMSGGFFDDPDAVPELLEDGTITLRFENCDSGVVEYEIFSLGLTGEIPIQRINPDNVARCLQEAQASEIDTAD